MPGIFNRAIFNDDIFNTEAVGGVSGKPWKQKWRQELADLLAADEIKPVEVPRRIRRAIHRALETAPADDSAAKRALRSELDRLKVTYAPRYLDALRYEVARQTRAQPLPSPGELALLDDEEAVIALLLH